MSRNPVLRHISSTLRYEAFWSWLVQHPACILRAGTAECVLFDHEHLHWTFTSLENQTELVQLLHGKRLVGELVIATADVTYVQMIPGENEEYIFELISETDQDRFAAYFFVLSHSFDDGEGPAPDAWVN